MTHVAFWLSPGVHLLDLAGPAQVFSTAANQGLDYRQTHVAERAEVRSAQGLGLRARTEWPELTTEDIIVVPGTAGDLRDRAPTERSTLTRLRSHYESGGRIASVCSGAEVLGRAGLLDGRRCTTHHELCRELGSRFPAAQVVENVLYVEDGRILTSAGIASGIDLALHLVAQQYGPAAAARVARTLVVYARRNGTDPQHSAALRHRNHVDDVVHRAQDVVDAHYTEPLRLGDLATRVGVSSRTLTRAFTKSLGMTPLRYQQLLRLERARTLQAAGATADEAARRAGFGDARQLRRLRRDQVDDADLVRLAH